MRRNSTNKIRPRSPWNLALAVVFLSGLFGAVADASDKSDSLTKEGIALRRAGRDAEAVRKLQAAYDLESTPKAAAQLGLCLQALGRWAEADGKLAEAISATSDAWIRKNRDTLKDSLEIGKTHVGRVEVIGEPAGSTVTMNGKNVGTLPLADAVPVNEGLVDVELSAAGYDRAQRSLTIVGGGYQSLFVRLTKKTGAPHASSPAPSAQSEAEPLPAAALTASPPTETESTTQPLTKNPWFWGGVAAVVVAGVVTAVVLSSGGMKDPSFTEMGNL